MTAALSLVYPGSRSLGEWWRQLVPLRPQTLWVAHLFLHRVEALVRLTKSYRPDRYSLLVLDALGLEIGQSVERLDGRLHLGSQFTGRFLAALAAEGLAQHESNRGWFLTPLGQHARRHREYPRLGCERRAFHFLESGIESPPKFLNLAVSAAETWPGGDSWKFDVKHLHGCVTRNSEWKLRHDFPQEVETILTTTAATGPLPSNPDSKSPQHADQANSAAGNEPAPWQRVVVHRPEYLLAVLIVAGIPGENKRLIGFAVQPKGWVLNTARPIISLGEDWPEVFPKLAVDPLPERWLQAWKTWGQGSGLPLTELEVCALERRDHRLLVSAPPPLIERLRVARNAVLKREVWLLAGDDFQRAGALVEVLPGRHDRT
jgi:hypothetical protein